MITARTGSCSPENVKASAGVPTMLVVKSENAQGCVRSFIIPDRDVEKILPAKGETKIDLGVLRPGRIGYSCGMGRGVHMATTTHVFRVEGMDCGSCALLIDDALEDLPGVHSAQTTVKKGRSIVELDPSQCTADEVIGAIDELGYRASSL
ncbi:cation transporter [Amycolatopsis roodepoortensis]|uniref:cation transporter n=1 Tax=Amycolatopsis roodepoortensis TaxID=700274 RepID=UPI00214C7CEB|nr:cation transporter [Amycolatopsis roodepoortensis]UUV36343.1 cation transporter [Amycolatopsis roodepoortensis]